MVDKIKETETTTEEKTEIVQNNTAGNEGDPGMATNSQTIEYLIYFVFGLLEVLLAFRLIFKLAGANTSSTFVNFIYGITGPFILPFEGIFSRGVSQGLETTSILEPATLVALVVYALLSWGIVMLVHIFSREKQQS